MRFYPVSFLILFGLFVCMIAAIQNQGFYSTYSAFYDSMGYYNQLAWVMHGVQDKGIWTAISDSYTHSTVFLPWLLGAFLSYFTEPSRLLGVAIQMPLIALQLFTGYRFFISTEVSRWRATLYSLPLITYPAIFNFNGGLGDFRMDLSLSLAYGSFLAALMVARKRDTSKEWIFVGFVISVACLFRATAPVYVFIVLGAALFLDSRRLGVIQSLQRYSLVGIVVVLLTGWFYILNFEYLYYYYFVWNTDAHARLPLYSSVRHIGFIIGHIGIPLLSALLIAISIATLSFAKNCSWRSFSPNWVALVGALVPAFYLVLSGAGLNPFVSMTAVPGFILFALHIGECAHPRERSPSSRIFLIVLLLALMFSIFTSVKSGKKDIADWIPYRKGVADLVDSIHRDAVADGLDRVVLTFLYLGSVDEAVITNHLLYEDGYKYLQTGEVNNNSITVGMLKHGFNANAEWMEMPGIADQEKVDNAVKVSLHKANYIVMADKDSDLPTHHRINDYAERVRIFLETSNAVEKLKSGITLSSTEKVTLYRVKKNASIK